MSAIPYAKPGFMSPSQAAWIAKRARKALRAGLLSHHQFAVLEVLLWEARPSGSDRATAAYSWLQKLAHASRQTVVDAIKAGMRLGLLRKIKHKTLVLWANGGRKWKQRPNEYVFDCESTQCTEYPKQVVQIHRIEPSGSEVQAAQDALEARRRVLEARMLVKGNGSEVRAS
jgi:hypothetical protein